MFDHCPTRSRTKKTRQFEFLVCGYTPIFFQSMLVFRIRR